MSKPIPAAPAGLAVLALIGSSLALEVRDRPASRFDLRSFSLGKRPGSSPFRSARPAAESARLRLEPGDRRWSDRFGRPGFDATVYALAAYDGSLIAGGDFTLAESTVVDQLCNGTWAFSGTSTPGAPNNCQQ